MRRGVAKGHLGLCATGVVVAAVLAGFALCVVARDLSGTTRQKIEGLTEASSRVVDGGAYFIQNVGQYPEEVWCYADVRGGRLWVLRGRIVLQLVEPGGPSDAPESPDGPAPCPPKGLFEVELAVPGGDLSRAEVEEPLPTKVSLFRGNDPSRWYASIPTFGAVRLRDVRPGVDLVIDARACAAAPWSVEAGGGSDAEGVAPRWESAMPVAESGGVLHLEVPWGEVALPILAADRRANRAGASSAPGPQTLVFGTYLGGALSESPYGLAVDGDGNILVGGYTLSPDLPAPGGIDTSYNGGNDIYVAKLSGDGSSLMWATYLGGAGEDLCFGLAADEMNNVVVAGHSISDDIPVLNGYSSSRAGGYDLYVAKVSASAESLLWATYVGGSGSEYSFGGVALDTDYNIVVAGSSGGSSPTPGGYDTTPNGSDDIYVVKLSASGTTLLWGTYIGGSARDVARGLALDGYGRPTVAGTTRSSDIPVPFGFGTTYHALDDGYVARLSYNGDQLLWGTYIGTDDDDALYAVAVDEDDNAVVAGYSNSPDLPVPGGYDTTHNGGNDLYVAKVAESGSAMLWGTYLGGTSSDQCLGGLAVDGSGNVIVAGRTSSSTMPVPGGYQPAIAGGQDIYLARLTSAGDNLTWGTYLGGSTSDEPARLAIAFGGVVVAGSSSSTNAPVPGGYDTTYNGGQDMYVARLAGPCSLTCSAMVPSSGLARVAVGFKAATEMDACLSTPAFDWDFGDGSAHGSGQNPDHAYAAEGSYDWTVTASANGASCSETGTIAITDPCTLTCSAAVPTSGAKGASLSFQSSATATDCPGPPSFDWDFGDGSAHAAAQNASHTYTTAGSFTWHLTVVTGARTCTQSGTVTIFEAPAVTGMAKKGSPFRIKVYGSNFQDGISLYINDQFYGDSTNPLLLKRKSDGLMTIKKGASLKTLVPKNVDTTFRFVNPDGGEVTLSWRWP